MTSFFKEIKESFSNLTSGQKWLSLVVVLFLLGLGSALFLISEPEPVKKEYDDSFAGVAKSDVGYKGNRFFSELISFVPRGKPDVSVQPVSDTGEDIGFSIDEQSFSMVVYPVGYFALSELSSQTKKAKRPGWFIDQTSQGKLKFASAAGIVKNSIIQIQAVSPKSKSQLSGDLNKLINSIQSNDS